MKYINQVGGVTYHGKATLGHEVFVGNTLDIYYDKNNSEKSGLLKTVKEGWMPLILFAGGSIAFREFIWWEKSAKMSDF